MIHIFRILLLSVFCLFTNDLLPGSHDEMSIANAIKYEKISEEQLEEQYEERYIDTSFSELTLAQLLRMKLQLIADLRALEFLDREDYDAIKKELVMRLSTVEALLRRYPHIEPASQGMSWTTLAVGSLVLGGVVYVCYKGGQYYYPS